MRKILLPPKRYSKETLEMFTIPLLVQHLASHEQYARLMLKREEHYRRYHENYLSEIYAMGHRKDLDGFSLEVAIARIDQIPFAWKKYPHL